MPTVVISENATRDFAGVLDTKIVESDATNAHEDQNLEATSFGSGDHNNALIKFSGLSNITGPVTVTSATLSLYHDANTGTNSIGIYRCLRDWIANQATWNVFSTGNSWGTAGGIGNGTDRVATASASKSVTGTGVYEDFTSVQLAQDVQDWINGVNSNFGWLVSRTDFTANNTTFDDFLDSVNGSSTQRPKLSVTYTAGGGTFLAEAEWQPLEPQTNPLTVSMW